MLEAVNQQEKVVSFQRADSELTVATVDTFLSETSVNSQTGGGGDERPAGAGAGGGETNSQSNNNAQQLLQRGSLYHKIIYHKNIGTIILIGTYVIRDIEMTRITIFLYCWNVGRLDVQLYTCQW